MDRNGNGVLSIDGHPGECHLIFDIVDGFHIFEQLDVALGQLLSEELLQTIEGMPCYLQVKMSKLPPSSQHIRDS